MLEHIKVMLYVFAMPGCPACEDYLPRFFKQLEGFIALGHPFVIYDVGKVLQPGQIPVIVLDSASQDPSVVSLADQYGVQNLPTTILQPKVGIPARYEGGLADSQIYNLFNLALATNH